MISGQVALVVFVCVFAGALLGMLLRRVRPEGHFSEDARDVIKLGMGLIATMAAMVLGLVIATAKTSYDAQDAAVKHTAAKILMLDRVLSAYGPETKDTRDLLRRIVAERIDAVWPKDRSQRGTLDPPEMLGATRDIEARMLRLSPNSAAQQWLKGQALQISSEIMETRWLLTGVQVSSIPVPFLVVLVSWLAIVFASFGLLAPRNSTVVAVLFVAAVSVAGSIFLILEMDKPFDGVLKVSSAPMRYALSRIGG